MKTLKFSSLFLLSLLMIWVCMPQLSAKHHRKYKCRSTSFAFNLNLDATPRYTQYNYVQAPLYTQQVTTVVQQPYMQQTYIQQPYMQPAYVQQTYVQQPYTSVVEQRTYYPTYQQSVVVQRPAIGLSIQPQFSYWRY